MAARWRATSTASSPTAKAALKALAEAPAQLILVAGETEAGDAASVCEALRDDARLGEAWLLAITDREDSKTAVAALHAGADDYLPRPFTRTELLARTRAGVRAAQQRSDDTLLRALMVNVPGAIYRSAWHADHTLALISDEIERISGYPPENFIASAKRTIMSIVHPDDRERVLEAGRPRRAGRRRVRRRVPDRARRRRRALGARPRPAGARARRAPVDGRRDLRHHRPPRGGGGAAPARGRGRALGGAARLARPHRRGRRRRPAQDRARPPRRRPAAARDARARRAGGAQRSSSATPSPRARSSSASARSCRRPRRSCASSPAASTPRC